MECLAAGDWKGPLEVIVAVPPSEVDTVRTAVAGMLSGAVSVVDNPSGGRCQGLNRAWQAATGSIVCRVDARSLVPVHYVRACVERLMADPRIGVVGAFQSPAPADSSRAARGVARALANPLALGAPKYRRRSGGGPADTVYLGAWRKHELAAIGGFDETLPANEDFELCQRYRRAGYSVWLEAGLAVAYVARRSPREVWDQYRAFGLAKAAMFKTGHRLNGRQAVALAGAGSLTLLVCASLGRPRRLLALMFAGVSALAIVDQLGSAEPSPVPVRIVAITTYPVLMLGWISGVVQGVLETSR
jgi:succinoglycan biosynthesis protein ExoA